MTKSPSTDRVGDSKTPPLKPDAAGLREAADQTVGLLADTPAKFVASGPLTTAARARQSDNQLPPGSCKQIVWLGFFFDGTGNNMDADVGTHKHSNVAKLYRVHHADDPAKGIYRIYIPGVGTYFDKVGDAGGSMAGLGMGSMGDARLGWALAQFDEKMRPHIARANSPANAILEVNVSVFGFSRGAALARAFVNRLLKSRARRIDDSNWQLISAKCRLRIRFMGLFDTVASVGVAMSKNNMSIAGAVAGARYAIAERLMAIEYRATRPDVLAFAQGAVPGADPAPGTFDGHPDWGGELAIPVMVEEVRHFVAAHELRNSFPVDSVTILRHNTTVKPGHFYESVYPGVHSDVGGSYRAGEDGKGLDATEKLGLIPLHQMYEFALDRHVPLRPKPAWNRDSKVDFDISAKLIDDYQYYWKKMTHVPILGVEINAHMRLYYAWRFRAIRLKQHGDGHEAQQINRNSSQFEAERAQLNARVERLDAVNDAALREMHMANQRRIDYIQGNYGNANLPELPKLDAAIAAANERQADTQDALLKEKAKRDALPDMKKLAANIAMYDAQLLTDARMIRDKYTRSFLHGDSPERRAQLRPHYKALMDAYEDEFVRHAGLTDERIIAFFDNYVHDSLAGFAKDASLPSDPRVVYLGGDEKYRYAMRQEQHGEGSETYASSGRSPATSAVDSA